MIIVIESNNVDYYEHRFSFKLKNSGGSSSSRLPITRTIEQNEELNTEIRRGKRARTLKDFRSDFYAYTLEEDP